VDNVALFVKDVQTVSFGYFNMSQWRNDGINIPQMAQFIV